VIARRDRLRSSSWRRLCPLSEIPEGGARGFDLCEDGEAALFLVRKEGEIFAYRDVCPHYGRTRLAWKRDAYLSADGTEIQCSVHGARFRIRDGVCTIGACLGQKLDAVPAEIREGQVFVAIGEVVAEHTPEGRP